MDNIYEVPVSASTADSSNATSIRTMIGDESESNLYLTVDNPPPPTAQNPPKPQRQSSPTHIPLPTKEQRSKSLTITKPPQIDQASSSSPNILKPTSCYYKMSLKDKWTSAIAKIDSDANLHIDESFQTRLTDVEITVEDEKKINKHTVFRIDLRHCSIRMKFSESSAAQNWYTHLNETKGVYKQIDDGVEKPYINDQGARSNAGVEVDDEAIYEEAARMSKFVLNAENDDEGELIEEAETLAENQNNYCNCCNIDLTSDDVLFTTVDDVGRVCKKCFFEKYATRCAVCNVAIQAGDRTFQYDGEAFHVSCFKCAHCDCLIGNTSFFPKDGKRYCQHCFEHRFLDQCTKCLSPITEKGVRISNKPFHKDCLICYRCSRVIHDKITEMNGNPMHSECFAIEKGLYCYGCDKILHIDSKYIADSNDKKYWHTECFICQFCKKNLKGEGYLYERKGISCSKCAYENQR